MGIIPNAPNRTPPEKNTQRRQFDALLDDMSDTGIRIVSATARGITQIEQTIRNMDPELPASLSPAVLAAAGRVGATGAGMEAETDRLT